MRRTTTILAVALALLLGTAVTAQEERLTRAQSLLDEGRPTAAIEALRPLLRKEDPRALLLRSTAHFMEGRVEEGRADLDRVLALAPDLRQAWLNRAGLDIAEQRYDRALEALETARRLDPSAPDSHLNIGAVLLLQGHLAEATASFERYLDAAGASADAHFLVATNYAGRGYAPLAIESLRRAIELDERYRLRARTDDNFAAIAEAPELAAVMETDSYRPAPGDHALQRSYPAPYDGGDGVLLSAVLEGLRLVGEPFDPRIEVTSDWALVHGDLRIKLSDRRTEDSVDGVLSLSAPAGSLSASEWDRRVERLLEAVEVALLRRQRSAAPRPDEPLPPGG